MYVSNSAAREICQLELLATRRQARYLDFAKKGLKHPKSTKLFSVREIPHQHFIRNQGEAYNKFAIPYWQRLLNYKFGTKWKTIYVFRLQIWVPSFHQMQMSTMLFVATICADPYFQFIRKTLSGQTFLRSTFRLRYNTNKNVKANLKVPLLYKLKSIVMQILATSIF